MASLRFPDCGSIPSPPPPPHAPHQTSALTRAVERGERKQKRGRGVGGGMDTKRGKTWSQGRRCNEERGMEAGKIRGERERERRCEV